MKLFRELLLEAADSALAEKLKAIYDGLSPRVMDTASSRINIYIESSNPDSKMLFKKFGFEELEKKQHGSYWEKKL